MKEKIINFIGCFIARWIIGSFKDGLAIKRKAGAEQIITVFSVQAYKNVIIPAIRRTVDGPLQVGDVVTDNGYFGEIVITGITNGALRGYSRKDGMVFNGLDSQKFKRVVGHVDLKIS